MTQVTNLQLKQIDISDDNYSCARSASDNIILCEQDDDGTLEQFWNQVVDDVRKDPTWFTFDNK